MSAPEVKDRRAEPGIPQTSLGRDMAERYGRRVTDKLAQSGVKPEVRMSGLRSSAILAMSIFVLANFCMAFYTPIKFDEFRFPYQGWAWWAFNDLKKTTEVHNVALLGSSLMVSAVAGVDANYLNKTLDLSQYHKASYLNDSMHTRFGGKFNTFNLSVPGQMPSDAYMTLKAMCATANRPDVVIYGVAPRDFIDSTMAGPADTEPFRYLRRLVSIDEIAQGTFRTPLAKLEWFLQKSIYMFGHAIDFQLAIKDLSESVINKVVACPPKGKAFTWWDRIKLIPNYFPGEIRPMAVMTGPISEKAARERWLDNTREYRERYKRPDKETYKTQFYFLKKLAIFCKKERIELVLINMPLTSYNIHLLSPPKYMSFVGDLHVFALQNGLPFYDMCTPSNYAQNDFHDSVHLNAYGGKKFFDQLINVMSLSGRLAQRFVLAGKDLERHQAVADADPIHVQ